MDAELGPDALARTTMHRAQVARPEPPVPGATMALAYLIGKVTAIEATGAVGALDAYLGMDQASVVGLEFQPGGAARELLELAADGDSDAEREFLHLTAADRSLRNLRPFREYRDTVGDAVAILGAGR
jgi:hypothetical protein